MSIDLETVLASRLGAPCDRSGLMPDVPAAWALRSARHDQGRPID